MFEGDGISAGDARLEERDVRLRNEMFPQMVLDDCRELITLRKVKSNKILRKFYTLLSIIAEKVSK